MPPPVVEAVSCWPADAVPVNDTVTAVAITDVACQYDGVVSVATTVMYGPLDTSASVTVWEAPVAIVADAAHVPDPDATGDPDANVPEATDVVQSNHAYVVDVPPLELAVNV